MGRKRRKPEVLWRAYGNSARTLAEAILYFLPSLSPPTSQCRCSGRCCLGCAGKGGGSRSFLLRENDPSEYCDLLLRSFAAVPNDVAPLTVFYPHQRWQQRQIVRNTIESLITNSSTSSNVICNGYNKVTRSSSIIDLLTTSAWNLLLFRVGDDLMVHLLKLTSIFLPVSNNSYLQVTGSAVSNLIQSSRFSIHKLYAPHLLSGNYQTSYTGDEPQHEYFNTKRIRTRKKLKLDAVVIKEEPGSSGINCLSIAGFREDDKLKKQARPFKWQRHRKKKQMDISENISLGSDTFTKKDKVNKRSCKRYMETSCGGFKSNQNELLPSFFKSTYYPKDVNNLKKLDSSFNCKICKGQTSLAQENLASEESAKQCIPQAYQYSDPLNKRTCISGHANFLSICPCASFCCLMLQEQQISVLDSQIRRECIFYDSLLSPYVFPSNHILRKLKPNESGGMILFRNIFGLSGDAFSHPQFRGLNLSLSECICHSFVKLLQALIYKAQRCQFLKLLNKHCPIPNSGQYGKGNSDTTLEVTSVLFHVQTDGCKESFVNKTTRNEEEITSLIRSFCPHKQVVSFIWAVSRNIIPIELLGSSSGWRAIRKNISKLVQLRRFENFYLKQCIHGVEVSYFPMLLNMCNEFVGSKDFMNMTTRIFEDWMFWFFSAFVVPIIRANFYVTETEAGKRDVFYYRKPIWKKITKISIGSLSDRNFHLLDKKSLGVILSRKSFGISRVRFLPKENGIRPLANLRAPSKALLSISQFSTKQHPFGKLTDVREQHMNSDKKLKLVRFRSVNSSLRDVYTVLKKIRLDDAELTGSSVFDYNDIYKKICSFCATLMNSHSGRPMVYIVVCDVSKAFDSIDQDLLLSLMNDILQNEEYAIKRYEQVVCHKRYLRFHNGWISIDQLKSCFPSNSVLVDQIISKNLKKEKLLHLLQKHLKHNILQIGRDFYLQEVGIPQGSILSSLLCSFYYGHLEKNVIFPFLEKLGCLGKSEDNQELFDYECNERHDLLKLPKLGFEVTENLHLAEVKKRNEKDSYDESSGKRCSDKIDYSSLPRNLLMRLIDDFLFISTSKKQAVAFLHRLKRGFRKYNCFMNVSKFRTNFFIDKNAPLSSFYVGEDGVMFLPWGGLLVNCSTFEIQADYMRYLGMHMSSTLTILEDDMLLRRLQSKLCDYMRPKCHPLFYDSNINSPPTVRLNVYQAFLLSAMKFHCYICAVPSSGSINSKDYLEVIETSLRYMYKLIRKRFHFIKLSSHMCPVLKLRRDEVEWLGLSAYIRILGKKQTRHTKLLSLLRSEIGKYGTIETAPLKYAVEDHHSSVFWEMKY